MNFAPRMALRETAGVLVAEIGSGVVTAEGLAGLCDYTSRTLDGEQPSVVLADMRRPLWAASDAEMTALYKGVDGSVVAPAALVVTEEAYALFKRHAWDLALQGILRKVFTEPAAAREWCALRLKLALHPRAAEAVRPSAARSLPRLSVGPADL